MERNSSNETTNVKSLRRRALLASVALVGSSSVLLLSGCSSALNGVMQQPSPTTSPAVHVASMQGKVHGGQQPVSSATVQIYEVSIAGTGYGSAASPVQESGSPVSTTTNGSGDWNYPAYTCASGSDELYVVATGGNPGLGGMVNNTSLALTAALGPCSGVASLPFVVVNEVTTVATAYSLAGFMVDTQHVGTSSTNIVGLTNAFSTFNNLVDLGTGQALTVTPAYATPPTNASPDVFRSIVPYDIINTLANVLSSCVNTSGGAACSSLFALTGSVTDTTEAALYIAHNPGLPAGGGASNISALLDLVPAEAPFQPGLSTTPNDLTLTLNFIGGGLGGAAFDSRSGGSSVGIDESGNLWVPNTSRVSVSELSNLGAPVSPTTTTSQTSPFTAISLGGWGANDSGLFASPRTAAADQNGNIWISDLENCLIGLNGTTGAPISGAPFTGACPGGSGTIGVTVDATDQVWAVGDTFITATSITGATVSGFPVTSGFDELTAFLGPDYTGHVWWVDEGNGHFGALNESGTSFAVSASAVLSGPGAYSAFGSLAASAGGNGGLALWIPEDTGGTVNVQAINVTGSINNIPTAFLPATEAGASGIAADGNSNFYFANSGGTNGASEVPANITVLSNKGSVISPPTTGYTGGSSLTALGEPSGVAVDQSGNLWVVNEENNNPVAPGQLATNKTKYANVTEFVGLAAPAQPVAALAAKNSTYGTEP
jgi:hypothetical protein